MQVCSNASCQAAVRIHVYKNAMQAGVVRHLGFRAMQAGVVSLWRGILTAVGQVACSHWQASIKMVIIHQNGRHILAAMVIQSLHWLENS